MVIFRHLTLNSLFIGSRFWWKYVRRARIKSFLIQITRKRWVDNKTTAVNGSQSPGYNSFYRHMWDYFGLRENMMSHSVYDPYLERSQKSFFAQIRRKNWIGFVKNIFRAKRSYGTVLAFFKSKKHASAPSRESIYVVHDLNFEDFEREH